MSELIDKSKLIDKSAGLLSAWKSARYVFGRGVLPSLGKLAARFGRKALLICNTSNTAGKKAVVETVRESLKREGITLAGDSIFSGAGPNAPRVDVYRIETYILHYKPDVIVACGGGSTIDACKAANILATLGGAADPDIDHWFGTGIVSGALAKSGLKLCPLVAVQTAAGSGAHLTKYSNITDPASGQKKLIVDDSIVPDASLFDYDVTVSAPASVVIDGILDTIAHCFEVFSGLPGGGGSEREKYDLAAALTGTALELVLCYAPKAIKDPNDLDAREALGLASDLGAYAIMVGGTHGPHMTSFSLVDLAGHGTACGLLNPYFAVFFAPAIEQQLRFVGNIFRKYGYLSADVERSGGRDLGIIVAQGMIAFSKTVGAPVTLKELPLWNNSYIDKILSAAKDPQLEMKLRNMPIPLGASAVDEYMGPVIRAAASGDLSVIRNPASH